MCSIEKHYQSQFFPIGTRILYKYSEPTFGQYQANITVKISANTWENNCYLYTNGYFMPTFNLYGPIWEHFKNKVEVELLNKVNII